MSYGWDNRIILQRCKPEDRRVNGNNVRKLFLKGRKEDPERDDNISFREGSMATKQSKSHLWTELACEKEYIF